MCVIRRLGLVLVLALASCLWSVEARADPVPYAPVPVYVVPGYSYYYVVPPASVSYAQHHWVWTWCPGCGAWRLRCLHCGVSHP